MPDSAGQLPLAEPVSVPAPTRWPAPSGARGSLGCADRNGDSTPVGPFQPTALRCPTRLDAAVARHLGDRVGSRRATDSARATTPVLVGLAQYRNHRVVRQRARRNGRTECDG